LPLFHLPVFQALARMRELPLNWRFAAKDIQKARKSIGCRLALSGIVAHSLEIAGPRIRGVPVTQAYPRVDRLGCLAGLTFHDRGGNGVTKIMKYHFYRLVKYLRMT
jgi:hypothetical protein